MKTEKILKQLLTTEQVAKKLNVCIFTIYRYIKKGKLKVIKLTPKSFRIEPEELNKFFKKRRAK